MSPSIAVFGAGPGLGRAVARRFSREGFDIALIGRSRERLDALAADVPGGAISLAADLTDLEALPDLIERIRAAVGEPDVIYYASQPGQSVGFVRASSLAVEAVQSYMPLALYTPLALVHAFLPAMVERGTGAILVAQGMAAVSGMPGVSGPGPALAAQRNYLQSLEAEVGPQGVFVGRLYIGAAIEGTPFHAAQLTARAEGRPGQFPDVDPDILAETLWRMRADGVHEQLYPDPSGTAERGDV